MSRRASITFQRIARRGSNSYVVKPVNFDEFSETVRQVSAYWLTVNQAAGER
jgi:hypothetical protein